LATGTLLEVILSLSGGEDDIGGYVRLRPFSLKALLLAYQDSQKPEAFLEDATEKMASRWIARREQSLAVCRNG
jgi:hypothetical protein